MRPAGLLAAAFLTLAAQGGTYHEDLRRRCARLQPHVEKWTGRKLGDVEILVKPRKAITENAIPRMRAILARVENGPRGDDLDAEASAAAEGVAHFTLAHVDHAGRIVFPDPAEERVGLLFFFVDHIPKSEFAKDPRAPDLVLLHELIHVHQHLHLESAGFYESIRSRSDILARRAVLEGHAEYVTREIASKIGLSDLYEKWFRSRTGAGRGHKSEVVRMTQRIAAADAFFAYVQGREFIDFVVEKLGYGRAMRKVFRDPPSLAQVARPEEYFRLREVSPWGPIFEDLRRWLKRERGEASIEVLALPMIRLTVGDASHAFRQGFRLRGARETIEVLIAESESGARELHRGWTDALERRQRMTAKEGLRNDIALRRIAVHAGRFIVDVECWYDSDMEQGAERLARRAAKFLKSDTWRKAWLEGGRELLQSADADLRVGAVTRGRRFTPDEDWEVRWLGYWYEARDTEAKAKRAEVLEKAIRDPHPAVVARGLRAVTDFLDVWTISWPLLRERLAHEEPAVRRAAWALVGMHMDEATGAEVLRLIKGALDDSDLAVRLEAVGNLTYMIPEEDPGVVEVMRKALRDKHKSVRYHALIVPEVYSWTLPELLPEFLAQLDEHPASAAAVLANYGEAAREALPKLREVLQNNEAREAAARAIWLIDLDEKPLFALVKESVDAGKPRGIGHAGELGSTARPLVPWIARVLEHEHEMMRVAAAEALGRIGGPDAEKALRRRLKTETDPRVLEAIRASLKTD